MSVNERYEYEKDYFGSDSSGTRGGWDANRKGWRLQHRREHRFAGVLFSPRHIRGAAAADCLCSADLLLHTGIVLQLLPAASATRRLCATGLLCACARRRVSRAGLLCTRSSGELPRWLRRRASSLSSRTLVETGGTEADPLAKVGGFFVSIFYPNLR